MRTAFLGRGGSIAVAATLLSLLVPAVASAATAPSITSSFTLSSIGVGDTSSLSITIKNNDPLASLSGVSFTDNLPTGVVVDDPNGTGGSCGTGAVFSAAPGSSTVSLSGGKLAGGASCTVDVAVTSNTAGSYQNSTGIVSSTEGGTGNSDTETLTVIAAPTVTLTSPKEGQVFNFGQRVLAHYSCAEAVGGPGLTDCEGDVPNGSPIDTSTSGAHTFDVTAISGDGQIVDAEIDYTVRPDNRFTVTNISAVKSGVLGFTLTVPGPGTISATVTGSVAGGASRVVFAKLSKSFRAASTSHVSLPPVAQGLALIKQARGHGKNTKHKKITLQLAIAYTPTGGIANALRFGPVTFAP